VYALATTEKTCHLSGCFSFASIQAQISSSFLHGLRDSSSITLSYHQDLQRYDALLLAHCWPRKDPSKLLKLGLSIRSSTVIEGGYPLKRGLQL
jgi:hypothetical protein